MENHYDLAEALDHCLQLLERGESIEDCIARYPAHADELRRLLGAAGRLHQTPAPAPSAQAMTAGRERMMAALAAKRAAQGRGRAAEHRSPLRWAAPWQRGLAFALLAVLLVGAALLLTGQPLPWDLRPRTAQATLTNVQGVVLRNPAHSDSWVPVGEGDRVEEGDRVRVTPGSQARLTFADGSASELAGDSEVTIVQMVASPEDETTTVVFQERGEARYVVADRAPDQAPSAGPREKAPPSLEVRTPAAVARGGGEVFSLAVTQDGTTIVRGERGRLAVTAGATTHIVESGETALVAPPSESSTGTPTSPPRPPRTIPSDLIGSKEAPEVNRPKDAADKIVVAEPTRTATPTLTRTATRTPTPTSTSTRTSTPTWTATPTRTPTATPTPTFAPANPPATSTPVPAPTDTSTPAPTDSPTSTPAPTATSTPFPTDTATSTPTPTLTPTSTPTNTPTPLPTNTPTPLPTNTPTPLPTDTPTPLPTNTPTPLPTNTPTPIPTDTPTPPPTATPTPPPPTSTPTPVPDTPTPTTEPSEKPTPWPPQPTRRPVDPPPSLP